MPHHSAPNPGLAAVFSLVLPGVGQFYTGHFLAGILWLIITPGFWIGSGGMLGWICHVLAAISAWNQAKREGSRVPSVLDLN